MLNSKRLSILGVQVISRQSTKLKELEMVGAELISPVIGVSRIRAQSQNKIHSGKTTNFSTKKARDSAVKYPR